MPRSINGVHHIAMSVKNLERSVAFYKEFDFVEEKRFEREDLRGKAVMLNLQAGGGEMRLEIWEFEDGVAPQDDLSDLKIRGLRHIAFAVEKIEEVHNEWKGKMQISAVQTGASGGKYCFLSDPDGIQVELYETASMEIRDTAVLIPYRIRSGEVEVYLQKRSKDAKRAPDCFGFFGGGINKGESGSDAIKREIREELTLELENPKLFKRYEFDRGTFYVFELKVGDNFEDIVRVNEGEYGKFFKKEIFLKKLIEGDKIILQDFFHCIHGQ